MPRFRPLPEPRAHEGAKHEGDACRFRHPAYGWGWFAVFNNEPDLDFPLAWEEEEPDDPENHGGWWVYTKDVM